jgi:hypothetical protein
MHQFCLRHLRLSDTHWKAYYLVGERMQSIFLRSLQDSVDKIER